MFVPKQKSTGTEYTIPIALLMTGFVVSPAVLYISQPVGPIAPWFALACSAFCVTSAWLHWRKYSALTIPTISESK
jgi:hypothetical protein